MTAGGLTLNNITLANGHDTVVNLGADRPLDHHGKRLHRARDGDAICGNNTSTLIVTSSTPSSALEC